MTAPRSPDEKITLLRSLIGSVAGMFQRRQADFLLVDRCPITYWLSDALLALIRDQPQIKSRSYVRQGICTTSNPRFTRFFWEVPPAGLKSTMVPFRKGRRNTAMGWIE